MIYLFLMVSNLQAAPVVVEALAYSLTKYDPEYQVPKILPKKKKVAVKREVSPSPEPVKPKREKVVKKQILVPTKTPAPKPTAVSTPARTSGQAKIEAMKAKVREQLRKRKEAPSSDHRDYDFKDKAKYVQNRQRQLHQKVQSTYTRWREKNKKTFDRWAKAQNTSQPISNSLNKKFRWKT